MQFLLFVIFIMIIGILIISTLTYMKVIESQNSGCNGAQFDPNSVYTKSLTIPVIGYQLNGKATFNPNNTFILDFGSNDTYPNNKWIYNTNSCSLSVSLDPNLQDVLSKYKSSINNTINLNSSGQLIVNGMIENVIPIQVILDKMK